MKLTVLGLLLSASLCGCAIFEEETHNGDSNDKLAISLFDATNPLESSLMFQQQVQQNMTRHNSTNYSGEASSTNLNTQNSEQRNTVSGDKLNINHYARGLMQDLVANLQYVNSTTPVAVTSFVMLDSDYNQSSLLGNQIAESLIHEVHKFGIPVIDFKATGYIRVTKQGDFAFSKDYEDFTGEMPALYIVGGTMLKHTDGYLINARIVGLKSQAVVASAQSFIPNHISDSILRISSSTTSSNINENIIFGADSYSGLSNSTRNSMSNDKTTVLADSLNKTSNMPLVKRVSLIQE